VVRTERFFKPEMINYAMEVGDGSIKTFALRGVKDNPPYLYDQRLLTLDDSVELLNLVLGDKLTAQEKQDLVKSPLGRVGQTGRLFVRRWPPAPFAVWRRCGRTLVATTFIAPRRCRPGPRTGRRVICVYVDGQAHDPIKRAPALVASWCAMPIVIAPFSAQASMNATLFLRIALTTGHHSGGRSAASSVSSADCIWLR
jgi:hypothetical protein